MGWNGDSSSYDFVVQSTEKEHIEKFLQLIEIFFPEAFPIDGIKLEAKPVKPNLQYYELTFSYEYPFSEVFQSLQKTFPEFKVFQKLRPHMAFKLEMVITRSCMNEYSNNYATQYVYVCSSALNQINPE
jgi:hypothetical protein